MAIGAAALVGAALGAAVLNAGSATANNFLTYEHNLKLQHDAQDWQEHMSNTAHQREMQDLQKAGLNPILTNGGQGASTGSVGANSTQAQPLQVGTDLMNMLNAGANFELTRSNADNMRQDSILKGTQVLTERQKVSNMIQDLYESKSREGLNRSKIREIDSNINLMKKQMHALDSTIELNFLTGNQAKANTNLLNEQINKTKAETKYTNERSRGFSETSSWSSGDQFHGFGLGRGFNESGSKTRTW